VPALPLPLKPFHQPEYQTAEYRLAGKNQTEISA
jgi:hypothetical protein